MAAPKGNEFWKLRSKHGRGRIIESPEVLAQASDEYFKLCIDNPIRTYDYKGKDAEKVEYLIPKVFQKNELARFCDLSEWRLIDDLKKINEDFSQVVTRIEGIIADQKYQFAVANIFNSNIVARDLGLADKSEVKKRHIFEDLTDEELDREIEKLT